MGDSDVGQLAGGNADVGAHHRIGVAVIRHDVIGALRHDHDVSGHDVLGDGATVAGLELTALVNVERNLPGGNRHIANAAFQPQAAGRQVELLVHVFRGKRHRLDRRGEAKADMHDVGAGWQHQRRRRRLVFLDQGEFAAGVGLGGINAPGEPSGDRRRIFVFAEPRVERERDVASRHHRHRCAWHGASWRRQHAARSRNLPAIVRGTPAGRRRIREQNSAPIARSRHARRTRPKRAREKAAVRWA